MKYYAVTNDPNELMHFGIKGMKWGIIRSPEQLGHYKSTAKGTRSKSPAYISASSKLRKIMKSGIDKAKANWNEYNSPQNKAIREYNRNERRAANAENRKERLFQKHVQLARQGRLKYKGISDEEIYRINDRLALENMARARSGQEKQSFARRLRSAAGEGIIQGVGQGTSGYISERMRGRGRTTAEIKGERRIARSHYTPVGAVHDLMNRGYKMAEARSEQRRANVKASIQEDFEIAKHNREEKRKAREERQDNLEKMEALAIANKHMGYDSAYDNNISLPQGRTRFKRLSNAQVKANIAMLEDAKKLYGTVQDNKAKGERIEERDEDGNVIRVHYVPSSKNNKKGNQDNQGNTKDDKNSSAKGSATPHGSNNSNATKTYNFNGHSGKRLKNTSTVDSSELTDDRYLSDPNQKHTVVKPGQEKKDERAAVREALSQEKPTKVHKQPPDDELTRYRKNIARMVAEADIKKHLPPTSIETEAQRKKRLQDEGFKYFEDRRRSREGQLARFDNEAELSRDKTQRQLQEQASQRRRDEQKASQQLMEARKIAERDARIAQRNSELVVRQAAQRAQERLQREQDRIDAQYNLAILRDDREKERARRQRRSRRHSSQNNLFPLTKG